MDKFKLSTPVVEVMADIVKAVEVAILPQLQAYDANIQNINYIHGHVLEVIETLRQYDEDPALRKSKYQLVILIQDFTEQRDGDPSSPYADLTMRVAICFHTSPEYKDFTRYEKVFKPVLYPIYQELIQQMYLSPAFFVDNPYNIVHTKKDRPYWGKEEVYGNSANKLDDFIDAIELNPLKIKQELFYCKNPINS